MTVLDVIICTHNPDLEYINRVLNALKIQSLNQERWNLIIIDNNSDTPLQSAVDLSWHANASIIVETKKGLSCARIRGIKETLSNLILFIDDDNIIPPNHLEIIIEHSEAYKNLGVFGSGKIIPEWEIEPKPSVLPYTKVLALKNVDEAIWSNSPSCKASNVFGAGMVVRRDVANAYVEHCLNNPLSLNLGRSGANLMSGEDIEFSYIACKMGYGKGVFPDLPIIHLISKDRVTDEYIIKLCCGNIKSKAILSELWGTKKARKLKGSLALIMGHSKRPSIFSFRLCLHKIMTLIKL